LSAFFRKNAAARLSKEQCLAGGVRDSAIRGNELPDQTDANAFERVYESYADKILNLAHRMTGNEEVARDLTQDVFIKVYQHLDTFEQRSGIYTWIYRIAVNHIYNYLKKERRHRWVDLLDQPVRDALREDGAGAVVPPSGEPPTDLAVEGAERAEVVWRAVISLPPKYRVPIVLYHYQEMSYKEIAEATGLSMSAVETRMYRGRKKLIKLLEPWIDRI
jgi:RNA polymerase sigma-70 factor (ECF subfamily)